MGESNQTSLKLSFNDSMDTSQSYSTMLETAQSDKKLALLDDIDKLRSQGISHYVHLPQLMIGILAFNKLDHCLHGVLRS
jgi:hypothetical protein